MQTDEAEILDLIRKLGTELKIGPHQLESLGLDSSFERDLGLDSLARMELISRVEEHFHVSLPEDIFATAITPRDLIRAIRAKGKIAVKTYVEVDLKREAVDSFPGVSGTLLDVLNWHCLKHPDSAHIKILHDSGGEEIITYRKLKEKAGKLAHTLAYEFEITRGNTIAIMLPMGADYFYTFFGIMMAGAVPVPIYPPANIRQVETHLLRHENILANSQSVMLITVDQAKELGKIIKSSIEDLNFIVTPTELIKEEIIEERPLGAKDIAFIQYTSGSTGIPKGVVLTHRNLVANVQAMGEWVEAGPTDVFVSWLPLYHDMGLIGAWFGSLYFSSLLVIMSPLSFIAHPIKWLKAISDNKGTMTAAPNFAYELCLKRIKDEELKGLDLSSLKRAFNGAEAVGPETLKSFHERFSPYGLKLESLMPVYGLAENSLGLTFPPMRRKPVIDVIDREKFMKTGDANPSKGNNPLKYASCGPALEGFQLRIIDEGGQEVGDRKIGHIQFMGPSSTSGYFRNPEASKKLFDGNWLNSGDLGYTVNGELYITGRSKDLIIHGGRNIYPEEIEQGIGDIEGIRKGCVAVFGSSDPVRGTERLIVVAETRVKDKIHELEKKIIAKVVDLVGSAPEEVFIGPPHTVLKTLNGKIRRSATRELFEKGELGKGEKAYWLFTVQLFFSALKKRLSLIPGRIFNFLYFLYFYFIVAIFVFPATLIVISLPALSLRWSLARFCLKILRKILGIKVVVKGSQNLPDSPFIFASNHASYLDGFILAGALERELIFVAKAELKNVFFIGLILKRINTQFVERFDVKKGIGDLLKMAEPSASRPFMFFPEGTFIKKPGLLPFRMGAFVLAVESNLPLIPVAMRGNRNILPPDSWSPRPGLVRITINAPLMPEKGNPFESALKLKEKAREQILLHSGEPDLSHERSVLYKLREEKVD